MKHQGATKNANKYPMPAGIPLTKSARMLYRAKVGSDTSLLCLRAIEGPEINKMM